LQKFGPNLAVLDGFVTAVSSRKGVLPIEFAGQVSCAQHEESEGEDALMAAFSFLIFFRWLEQQQEFGTRLRLVASRDNASMASRLSRGFRSDFGTGSNIDLTKSHFGGPHFVGSFLLEIPRQKCTSECSGTSR
jgi:hypothetical protein